MAGRKVGIPDQALLVVATPLYLDGMSGLLKTVVDRMMPLTHPALIVYEDLCSSPLGAGAF